MQPHQIKLIETAIGFIQYMASIMFLLTSANGAAFFYYWTSDSNELKVKDFWPFLFPASILIYSFADMGLAYRKLFVVFSDGALPAETVNWIHWMGVKLIGLSLFVVVFTIFALIKVHGRHNSEAIQ